ncbi:MAG: Ig-like domain-containing protein, partial [Holdemanella sp.]|nr:Ig-like domain-containing protein [Holdemanella sp.]
TTIYKPQYVGTYTDIYINPEYADVITEDDILIPGDTCLSTTTISGLFYTKEEAGMSMINSLINRYDMIILNYAIPKDQWGQYASDNARELGIEILNCAMVHTGNPVGGDYLERSYSTSNVKRVITQTSTTMNVCFQFSMSYYTNAVDEFILSSEINNILFSLNVTNAPDYVKVKAIYDWICSHISYDYGSDPIKYSAYAGVMNGKCVCQGYATLFYRLALTLGVDARYIRGRSHGENHAWNIVKIGDYYYNLDSTWDAGQASYNYFLKTDAYFTNNDHERRSEYATSSFTSAYPMTPSNFSTFYSFGINQTDQNCLLNDTGTLTFSASPSNSFFVNQTKWESSDESVVTIDQNGQYRCVGLGNATITATAIDGKQSSILIYVEEEQFEEGWQMRFGKWCYGENGELLTGWQTIDGVDYYFNEEGLLRTGWYGDQYLREQTREYIKSEYCTIDGSRYYFDENGHYATGFVNANGIYRLFDDNGKIVPAGWRFIDGYWYYANNYEAVWGWQLINNRWYLFENYKMVTGMSTTTFTPYYFDENGYMQTGWKLVDGIWYYFTENGALNGWQYINNVWYYFDDYKMVSNGFMTIGNYTYYFDGSGAMKTGWQFIDNNWYYFNANGAMQKAIWYGDYYLDKDGIMVTYCYVHNPNNGNYYWVGNDGKYVAKWTTTIKPTGYIIYNQSTGALMES